ncbi:MAG: DNA (cytosine-5-)-methyltransferase [Planctomycetia bacterium]|nr:DNA (cytosine-5-)-methyltransferase [Planctomycetia bacterium]
MLRVPRGTYHHPNLVAHRNRSQFRFVDLFAGVGGFHHALASPEFGGVCELAVEIDPAAQRTYGTSFRRTQLIGDIRAVTETRPGVDRSERDVARLVPDHEVLCGGFPCQPFSKSGAQDGVRDKTRGTLFFDILQIIRAKHPRFVILENVRNLAGPRHRDTWRTIVESLRCEGYRVADEPVVFSPHNLPQGLGGAPQVRERVFILAQRVAPGAELTEEPLVQNEPVNGWSPSRWRIEDILDTDETIPTIERYRLRPEESAWLEAWAALVRDIPDESLPGFPIWVDAFASRLRVPSGTPDWKRTFLEKNFDWYQQHKKYLDRWSERSWLKGRTYRVADFPASRRKFEWQARSFQPRRSDRDLWKLVIHLRPSGIRVKPPTYVPALVAITQTSIIGSRRRRMTPAECARLQGIPPEVFAAAGVPDRIAYKQLGNAVNVGAVRWVARALFRSAGLDWGASLDVSASPGRQRHPPLVKAVS